MRGLASHRARAVAVAALLPLAAAACTGTGSGGGATSAVSTSTTFSFPSGTAPVSGVQQPLDLLQLAPSTTWSQTVQLSNGTSSVGTSTIALVGGAALNADGTLPATLSLTVTASGTGNVFSNILIDPITQQHDVTCTSTSTATTCSMPVTLPAASATSPVDVSIDATAATPQGSSTSWWTGGMQIGGTVWGVGFVTVPGATLQVDTTAPITNQTVYDGTQTTCSAVPVSSVQWLSPQDQANSSTQGYYSGSSSTASSCPVTFTTLSPGNGASGVQVTAPT